MKPVEDSDSKSFFQQNKQVQPISMETVALRLENMERRFAQQELALQSLLRRCGGERFFTDSIEVPDPPYSVLNWEELIEFGAVYEDYSLRCAKASLQAKSICEILGPDKLIAFNFGISKKISYTELCDDDIVAVISWIKSRFGHSGLPTRRLHSRSVNAWNTNIFNGYTSNTKSGCQMDKNGHSEFSSLNSPNQTIKPVTTPSTNYVNVSTTGENGCRDRLQSPNGEHLKMSNQLSCSSSMESPVLPVTDSCLDSLDRLRVPLPPSNISDRSAILTFINSYVSYSALCKINGVVPKSLCEIFGPSLLKDFASTYLSKAYYLVCDDDIWSVLNEIRLGSSLLSLPTTMEYGSPVSHSVAPNFMTGSVPITNSVTVSTTGCRGCGGAHNFLRFDKVSKDYVKRCPSAYSETDYLLLRARSMEDIERWKHVKASKSTA